MFKPGLACLCCSFKNVLQGFKLEYSTVIEGFTNSIQKYMYAIYCNSSSSHLILTRKPGLHDGAIKMLISFNVMLVIVKTNDKVLKKYIANPTEI